MQEKKHKTLKEKIPHYDSLKNLFFYALFGGIAALLDFGIFYLLTNAGIIAVANAASAISNVCGFLFTFTTNTFLNFKKTDKLLRRFATYGVICLIGIGISSLGFYYFEGHININVLKIIMLVIVSGIQFVLNKIITYKN